MDSLAGPFDSGGNNGDELLEVADDGRQSLHVAYRAVLLAAALIAGGLLFRQLATLLLAILITVIIAIPLAAFADRLERYRVPRGLGVTLGLLSGLAVLAGLLTLVIPSFIHEANHFIDRVPKLVDDLRSRVHEATGASKGEVGAHIQRFLRGYTHHPERLAGPAESVGIGIAGALAAFIVVVITAAYMAARPEPLIEGLVRVVPPAQRPRAERIMFRLRESWLGWLRGMFIHMILNLILVYVALALLHVPFAMVFAVLSSVLIFIPYFGSIAAAFPPVLVALTESSGKAVAVLAVYVVLQQLQSNILMPLIMARTAKLHPATIAVGVLLVGALFGPIGLFVSVPVISLAMILVDEMWVRPMEDGARARAASPLLRPREDPVAEHTLTIS